MAQDTFERTYFEVGTKLGLLAAIATFIIAWWWCAAEYGFLLGFGLGWLPSAILAVMVGFAARVLWPLILIPVGAVLIQVVKLYPREILYALAFSLTVAGICVGAYAVRRRWPTQSKQAFRAAQRFMIVLYALLLAFALATIIAGG